MYNVFEEIKERVSMQEAARFYGLQTDRSGMACCPFHNEKTPSLIFTASAAGQRLTVQVSLQSCLVSHSMGDKKCLCNLIIERFNWFSVLKLD